MNFQLQAVAGVSAALILAGCGTINADVKKDIEQKQIVHHKAIEKPVTLAAPASRVREIKGVMMPVTEITSARKGEWLKKHRVQLDIRVPTPMTAVVQKLADQGINVTSDLPLDSYTYVGKINPTDAETALQIVLGSIGVDYQVNDARKLVVIKPLTSRTWYLNIGNRKSSYTSGGQLQATSGTSNSTGTMGGDQSSMGQSGGQSMGQSSMGQFGGQSTGNGASTGNTSGTSNASSGGGTGTASADDFWPSLSAELTNRLTVMIPRAMASQNTMNGATPMGLPGTTSRPPLPPQGMQSNMGGIESGGELYVKHQIGGFSLNPETGAVTIQAPHWLLNDFDAYILRVQEMYNTDISFQGELVLVTANRSDSEGLDISAFATWAGSKYGAVVSNNALGGVTLTVPSGGGLPSVSASAQAVAGPLIGLTYNNGINALNIFNSYLSEHGQVSVIQRPLITTTSGVPGVFSKKFTDYYNTVSQQAAAGGTGSAATATQNVLVPVELGTELRINPRIDITTGLIRAQLTLNQAIKSGLKTVPQTITYGSNTTTINTTIPLITKQNLSGEILLRDGDLVVVGGQTEDNQSHDDNGLPGKDGPLGAILGVKKAVRGAQTYYFALRVTVNKRK